MKSKDYFYISLFTILFSFNLIRPDRLKSVLEIPFSLEDKALQVSARTLTSQESTSILKYDVTAKGYKPVEVTIANPGSHSYTISRASTSLPCATSKDIAWKQTKGTLPLSIGIKALGFIFWPFSIVSGIEGIATLKKHKQIVSILNSKGFKDDGENILPYSLVKRVLYIPKDKFEKTFTLSLEDITTNELVVIPVEAVE